MRLSLAGAATLLVLLTASAGSASAATTSGTVEAGGSAIQGSSVELFQAGTQGAQLLAQAKTDQGGQFELSYSPDLGAGPLYAVATGGKVGKSDAGRRIRLMSILGQPDNPPGTVFVTEQTTVASAYALAQFLNGKTVAGPWPGMPNAADTAANLMEARTGKLSQVLASAPNGSATEALPTFNTLANALARCTRGGKRNCRELFEAVQLPDRKRPVDTLDAVHDIALFPSQATNELFDLQGSERYAPSLDAPPDAWTVALVYTGAGMDAPGRMAFDSSGNIWVVNNFQTPGSTAGRDLSVLSPTGEPILGSPITGGGLGGAGFGVAIDQQDRAWVGNFAGAGISLFTPLGQPLSPACGPGGALPCGFTQGGISKPQGIAIDQQGSLWIPNFGGASVTIYRNGDPAKAEVVTGAGIVRPFAIAIDSSGAAWVTDQSTALKKGAVTKIESDGTPAPISPISGGGLRSPQGIAVDARDNLWVANLASSSVTQIGSGGKVSRRSPIKVPSLKGPWGIAVDGDGNVWVAGFVSQNLTQLCGLDSSTCPGKRKTGDPISPRKSGYTSEGLQHLTAVQIDPSGNVWAANNWSDGSSIKDFVGGNGLVELVGAAAPVRAPLIGPVARP